MECLAQLQALSAESASLWETRSLPWPCCVAALNCAHMKLKTILAYCSIDVTVQSRKVLAKIVKDLAELKRLLLFQISHRLLT
jgi:hypothetical protein